MGQIVVITAVGEDRPGIVAALARAMYDVGANLDDTSMTQLHNVFTTMVSAVLPDGKTADDCREALRPLTTDLGMTVTVQEVARGARSAPPDHLLTVYGTDKPGIVYRVASQLAARGINITDMDTRRAGTEQSPIYIMFMEIASGEIDLSGDIATLRRDLEVDISLQSLEREAL